MGKGDCHQVHNLTNLYQRHWQKWGQALPTCPLASKCILWCELAPNKHIKGGGNSIKNSFYNHSGIS